MTEQKDESIRIPKKYITIGVIFLAIITVGVISYLIGSQKNSITGGIIGVDQKQSCPFECCINDLAYQNKICQGSNYQCSNNKCVKTNCPYECCIEGEYSTKVCQTDYDCQDDKCVAIDSDKDGLTNIQEKEFGSNPLIFDTDSEGLNDYAEKQKGTNPNNPNTDGDRYNDNIDPNPITKNSAVVNVQLTDKEWAWDILGILNILKGDLNIRIATVKADVSVQNTGDDHSDYTRFDIVFELINTEVKRIPESIGRLNTGETANKHYEYELKLSDIPNALINYVTQKSAQWDIKIQNVNYESFL
ncbi:MAG: hypothetical protein V1660_00035 [archaeon]